MIWNSGAPNDGGCCGCRTGACDPCFPRCGHAEDVAGDPRPYVKDWDDLTFSVCAGCSFAGTTPWDGFLAFTTDIYCRWYSGPISVAAYGTSIQAVARRVKEYTGGPWKWMFHMYCGSGHDLWGGFWETETSLTPMGVYTWDFGAGFIPDYSVCNSEPETIEIILAVPPP